MTYDLSTLIGGLCVVLGVLSMVSWTAFMIALFVAMSNCDIPDNYTFIDFILGKIPKDSFYSTSDAGAQYMTTYLLRAATILTMLYVLIRPIKL